MARKHFLVAVVVVVAGIAAQSGVDLPQDVSAFVQDFNVRYPSAKFSLTRGQVRSYPTLQSVVSISVKDRMQQLNNELWSLVQKSLDAGDYDRAARLLKAYDVFKSQTMHNAASLAALDGMITVTMAPMNALSSDTAHRVAVIHEIIKQQIMYLNERGPKAQLPLAQSFARKS